MLSDIRFSIEVGVGSSCAGAEVGSGRLVQFAHWEPLFIKLGRKGG